MFNIKDALSVRKQFFGNWKPFKNDEKRFLFHLQSSFRFWDIYSFTPQSHRMVKHTQTIRLQIADELFKCVWTFCEIGAKRVKLLFWCFDHVGIPFDKKANVNFKIYDVTNWITNNYNSHIARGKDNQIMKFDQLKEYVASFKKKKRFRSFFKTSKFRISLDQQSEVSYSLFLLYVQVKDNQELLKLRCCTVLLLNIKHY